MFNFVHSLWQRFIHRRHPAVSGKHTITRQKLYILPTYYGLAFGVTIITLLVGALNYQLSLGFFFAFLLCGLAHAVMLRSYANLLGLEICAGNTSAVFAGENARFALTLYNHKAQSRWGIRISSSPQHHCEAEHIKGLAHCIVTLAIPAQHRGRLALPRLRIESTQPLALFRCWTYLHLRQDVLVYPAPEADAPPLPQHNPALDGKEYRVTGNDDFHGLREFQRGDARHDIAWKQSAHSANLMVRQYQSPLGESLWLDGDALPLAQEAKLSRLCAWILKAHEQQRPYGLILHGAQYAPALNHEHQARCLSLLANDGAQT